MLSRFDRAFVWANQFVVGTLLLIMAVLVFANVALRYAAGISLPWVEELTRYMMIWVSWLAVGLAMREGAHIAIDNLQNALPEPWARLLRLVVFVAIVVFFAAVAWYGWQYASFAWRQQSAVLRLSLGAVYMAIPIGSLLMLGHVCLTAHKLLAARDSGDAQAQAAEFSVL
ncbi:TRAP transporter small permease [Mycoplana sp. MJR14]|uniref:TRAP transporter small permease n=1 Tax=Mycoplana sp. MJR14 TaxID=3032583 RepID=UPI0023D991E2|nr:TRAP transporter small permease [Mycoplana sp. MJR14]MDF1632660.1 TRAP transporter small permease [Mycoplana sp. MJR14]